jgi:hypothetical protein
MNGMLKDSQSGLILPAAVAEAREEERKRAQLQRMIYIGVIKQTAAEIWQRWTGEPADGWAKIQIKTEVPDA